MSTKKRNLMFLSSLTFLEDEESGDDWEVRRRRLGGEPQSDWIVVVNNEGHCGYVNEDGDVGSIGQKLPTYETKQEAERALLLWLMIRAGTRS